MEIGEPIRRKADARLRDFLSQARGDEVARTILHLGTKATEFELPPRMRFGHDRFRDREVLIAERQDTIGAAIADAITELRKLELNPLGGRVSPVVVVDGTARQIAQALHLDSVRQASLDQPIDIIEPKSGWAIG